MKNKTLKNISKLMLVGVLACLAVILILKKQRSAWEGLPNIIVVTISGARNAETIKDEKAQYMPNFRKEILKNGTLYTNLYNKGPNFHMPAAQAKHTGIASKAYYLCSKPTIFNYIGKKYKMPKTKLWALWHWGDDEVFFNDPKKKGYPCYTFTNMQYSPEMEDILNKQELQCLEKYLLCYDGLTQTIWDACGKLYWRITKKIIKKFKPKVIFLIAGATEVGHASIFSRYAIAVKEIDKNLLWIWKWINEEPYYKDNTYFIICVDHDRDSYYMDHNDSKEQVWLYIYGPGIKKGITISRRIYHIDIFATIAKLMNVSTHPTEGKILFDSFVETPQAKASP